MKMTLVTAITWLAFFALVSIEAKPTKFSQESMSGGITEAHLANRSDELPSDITKSSVTVVDRVEKQTPPIVTEVTSMSGKVTDADMITNNVTTERLFNTTEMAPPPESVLDENTSHPTTNDGQGYATTIDLQSESVMDAPPTTSSTSPSSDESLDTTATTKATKVTTEESGWSFWDWIPFWQVSYEVSDSDPKPEPQVTTRPDAGFVDGDGSNDIETSIISDYWINEHDDNISKVFRDCEVIEGESMLSNCRGSTSRDITLCCRKLFLMDDSFLPLKIVHDSNNPDVVAIQRNVTIGEKFKCIELSPTLWNTTDEYIIPAEVECDIKEEENEMASITEERRHKQPRCNLTHFSVTETPEDVHPICLNLTFANYRGLDSTMTCIIEIDDDVMNRVILHEDGFYVETLSDVDVYHTLLDILFYLIPSSDKLSVSAPELTNTPLSTKLSIATDDAGNTTEEATTLPTPLTFDTDVTSVDATTSKPMVSSPQPRLDQLYLKEEIGDAETFSFFDADMMTLWGVDSHRQVERVELEVKIMELMGMGDGGDDRPVMILICTY